jgi:AraC family transcriptional regulator
MNRHDYRPADDTTMQQASVTRWPGLELLVARDDIRRPTEWRIAEKRHVVIVHLGGAMTELETELESHGGSRGPALPGEHWAIPAGHHYVSRARGTSIHYAVLYLDVRPAASHLCNLAAVNLAPRSGVRDEFLYQSVRRLAAEPHQSDDTEQMFRESLSQTIYLHLHHRSPEATTTTHDVPPTQTKRRYSLHQTRQLRDYIHDRLDEKISLSQLAHVSGQTIHTLLADFRSAFGTSPWQYIIAQRLRLAQRLLTHTRKDITTIAFEAGFSSHSHLTRAFTHHLGRTPSAFRKNVRP